MIVGATRALFSAGLRHQTSYRFAMASGLITNMSIGLVRLCRRLLIIHQRGRCSRAAEVRDLSLEPPALEDVIRRIYRGDTDGPLR